MTNSQGALGEAKSRGKDLCAQFYEYFEVLPADTEVLLHEVFQLRFQVYCVETGFERKEDCRREVKEDREIWLETDEYDHRAVHYLVRHRRTGLCAATVRLVLPNDNDINDPYPIENHCLLDDPVKDPDIRKHLAEISRFAVSREFKKRRGEAKRLAGISEETEIYFEPNERRILPHMTVGLFAGIVRMSYSHNITHWYAVMEPALLRLLRLFGIRFVPIGPDVDYHGLRRPCLAEVKKVLPNMRRVNSDVWDLITDYGKYASPRIDQAK